MMMQVAQHGPVTAQDRVSDVLERDESLVEVFARHAPHFAKLRNRTMRRVMARLVTVEQAAHTARVSVEQLVDDLNAALGMTSAPAAPGAVVATTDEPSHARPANAPVVELDVRDDLRHGREPFSRIMTAVAELADEEVLHLRVIFEPVPLFGVLAKRGFAHESREHAPDDWSVWFWRAPEEPPAPQPVDVFAADNDPSVTWLDVRGGSPPEPMLRTLAALETLPRGHTLVQINSRVPQFLFPVLAERGFACEVDESRVDRVLIRIWHAR